MDYDELAADYGANRRPDPAVANLLSDLAGASGAPLILEIGVGTGNFASMLEGTFPTRVYGIDPSIEMLRQVAGPAGRRIARARAEQLPFAEGTFTLVYSVDVIHHVKEREKAAGEAFRVLQPGGQIVIVTDSEEDIANRVPLSRYFPETIDPEIARYPRIDTLEIELSRAGFTEIVRRQTLTRRKVTDITPYRMKAFSSLHLISPEAHARGVAALAAALRNGPIPVEARYTILAGRKTGS